MAIQFMDGFDQYQGAPSVAALMAQAGYVTSGNIGAATGRRVDTKAIAVTNGSIGRTFVSSADKVVIGFAYRNTLVRDTIFNVANVGTLTWNTDTGKLSFAGVAGTATALLGLWYYLEIVVDKTAGTVKVFINNEQDIEAPLPETATFLTNFICTWAAPGNDTKYLDDLIFIDSSTGANVAHTDRVGPIQISSRMPEVDVLKEWSTSTGVDHYPLVDNQPPVDAQYIQSNTSGAMDLFLADAALPSATGIVAVGVTVYNRKSDVDARQLGIVVGAKGAGQLEVVDAALSTTNKFSFGVFEKAPGGVSWTDELVGDTPFGVVVRP